MPTGFEAMKVPNTTAQAPACIAVKSVSGDRHDPHLEALLAVKLAFQRIPHDLTAGLIDKLSKALSDICREKQVVDLITGMGAGCIGSSPGYLAAAIQADLPVVKAAVDAAGVAIQ